MYCASKESVCVVVVKGTPDFADTEDTVEMTKMQTYYYFPEDQAEYTVSVDMVVKPLFSPRYSMSKNDSGDGAVAFILTIEGE